MLTYTLIDSRVVSRWTLKSALREVDMDDRSEILDFEEGWFRQILAEEIRTGDFICDSKGIASRVWLTREVDKRTRELGIGTSDEAGEYQAKIFAIKRNDTVWKLRLSRALTTQLSDLLQI
jgi:hypothetical protein